MFPQVTSWIWGILSPGQHLKLFVTIITSSSLANDLYQVTDMNSRIKGFLPTVQKFAL